VQQGPLSAAVALNPDDARVLLSVDADGALITTSTAGTSTATILGTLADAAWNGSGNPASLIALWKAMYVQLAAINTNTTTP
jgi:hypothetical protein